MAKNKDGFEAGKPVSNEDLQRIRAQQRMERSNGKGKEEVRPTTKRERKSLSEPAGEKETES